MPKKVPVTNAAVVAYSGAHEHLADELRRIDLLLHAGLLRQRARQPGNPLEAFKGLVVTEEEVTHLLERGPGLEADGPGTKSVAEALGRLSKHIRQRRAASADQGVVLPLAELADLFSLSALEEDCLLLALAPELDRKYEKLYGFLQDDITRKQPCPDLVLDLSCPTAAAKWNGRKLFSGRSPLLHYRLIELGDAGAPLISRPIKLDDRIVDYLLGTGELDERVRAPVRVVDVKTAWGDPMVPAALQTRMQEFIRAHGANVQGGSVLFHLHGPDGSAFEYLAGCVARETGLPLLIGDAARLTPGPLALEEAVWLLAREACLQPAALALENFGAIVAACTPAQLEFVVEAAHTFSRVSFLFGRDPWRGASITEHGMVIDVPLPAPNLEERKRLWETRLAASPGMSGKIEATVLAGQFRLSAGQIDGALAAARAFAGWRSPLDQRVSMDDLHRGCRAQSGHALELLARKIAPTHRWEHIVLPAEALAQLREICARVQRRHEVFSLWGFDHRLSLGRGVNALFSGPSGTGKTMAAEIIAHELGLDLYKIDLSGVVSKYIGETEKNLSAVFAAAENSNAILFFDEADALFGKRSEVRDSHDRYANLEISFLLQKMEEYDGIAILATNLRQNLDDAFVRRLAFAIQFPFPEEADRHRIWKGIWPAETPLAEEIDFALLSRRFKLSGGNIRNVALAAAFLAATNGGTITMEHLLHATRREYQKLGKALSDAELAPGEANARPISNIRSRAVT